MHCVDLGKSFQTHIYLQNLVSIQPRTSPLKFAVRATHGSTSDRLPREVLLTLGQLDGEEKVDPSVLGQADEVTARSWSTEFDKVLKIQLRLSS